MSNLVSMLEEAVANGWRVLATADGHFALTHNGSLVVDLVPPVGGEGWGNAHPALIIQSPRRGEAGGGEAYIAGTHDVIGDGKGSGASGYLVGDGACYPAQAGPPGTYEQGDRCPERWLAEGGARWESEADAGYPAAVAAQQGGYDGGRLGHGLRTVALIDTERP